MHLHGGCHADGSVDTPLESAPQAVHVSVDGQERMVPSAQAGCAGHGQMIGLRVSLDGHVLLGGVHLHAETARQHRMEQRRVVRQVGGGYGGKDGVLRRAEQRQ